MAKIGLFYGTDTGNTERVSKRIKELIEAKAGTGEVDLLEIYKKKKEKFEEDLLDLMNYAALAYILLKIENKNKLFSKNFNWF